VVGRVRRWWAVSPCVGAGGGLSSRDGGGLSWPSVGGGGVPCSPCVGDGGGLSSPLVGWWLAVFAVGGPSSLMGPHWRWDVVAVCGCSVIAVRGGPCSPFAWCGGCSPLVGCGVSAFGGGVVRWGLAAVRVAALLLHGCCWWVGWWWWAVVAVCGWCRCARSVVVVACQTTTNDDGFIVRRLVATSPMVVTWHLNLVLAKVRGRGNGRYVPRMETMTNDD
jgi:hypothetical protein